MTSAIKLYPAGPNQGTNPFVVTGIVYPSIGYSYAIATLPYSNAGSIVPAVAWSVINLGFIKITNAGGVGIDLTAGGSVSNVDTASIRGGYGVKIYAQAGGTVSNAGYIGGTGSSGAYQHSPGVGADIYAFSAASGTSQGTVSNAPGGTIVGANAGVSIATSAAVLSNAGYIGGTGLGSAGGVAYGVVLDGASSVDNSGRVVDSGTGGAAVMLEQGGVVENTHSNSSAPGLIRGGRYGVLTKGGPATIMNTGAINGTSVAGIDLQAGGTVTNARYGTVLGGRAGVLAFASATVLNSGGIYYNNAINTAGYGIAMYAGGTVVNTGYAATHQPAGTITGVKILNGPGSVTNGAASIIDTGRSGRQNFAINLAGSVSNYGLIAGGGGVRASDAIYGTTTVTASVTNEGTVNGRYYGVKMFGDLSHQGRNAGVVTTNGQAVFGNLGITTNLGAGLSFVTYGTILGSTGVLIEYATATATNLGAVKGNGSAANYPGTTRHNGYGIQIYFSDGTITNGSTADNTAYIHGARYGVSVLYGAATIANFGTIDGAVGLASYDGSVIVYPASFNTTVINAGTIATTQTASINGTIAFTGNAIQFGRGDNRLVEMPSAAILGHVIAAAGNSMLELASGSNAGTLSGVGGTIGDFAAISIDTGSNWYLDGSNVDSLTSSAASITNAGTLNVRPGGAFRLLGTQATGIIVRAGSTLTLPTSGDTLTATGSAVVVLNGAGATLANSGAVVGSGLFGIGVSALTSGLVINGIAGTASTSLIYGGSYGVALEAAGATLSNYAQVRGSGLPVFGIGVGLASGAVLQNMSSGAAVGYVYGPRDGVKSHGGSIANTGSIIGGTIGVYFASGNFTASTLNNAGSIIGGTTGVDLGTSVFVPSTLTNTGTIVTRNVLAGAGVKLASGGLLGGVLLNGAGGTVGLIDGYIGVSAAGGTVVNDATIISDFGIGVAFGANSATFANGGGLTGGALVRGAQFGVRAASGNGLLVTNHGTIIGGVGLRSFTPSTTVTNDGTIAGTVGASVELNGSASALIDMPGAVFSGTVIGNGSDTVLDLLAGSVGILQGFGISITGMAALSVSGGAIWELAGQSTIAASVSLSNAGTLQVGNGDTAMIAAPLAVTGPAGDGVLISGGGTLGAFGAVAAGQTIAFVLPNGAELIIGDPADFAGTITNFVQGATIDFPTLSASNGGVVGGQLSLISAGVVIASVPVAGSFVGERIIVGHDSLGGTTVTVNAACFAEGTRIWTQSGPVPIEQLSIGATVLSAFGGTATIIWTGHRRIDCTRHPRQQDILPVRVLADAFGPGRPERDVVLSPDHAVYVEQVLIPIRLLANGTNITQFNIDAITYWHVELTRHDVILAEGLPTESYLDTGNRSAFANSSGVIALHPEFGAWTWEAEACAPLIVSGPKLDAARQWLSSLATTRSAAARPAPTRALCTA